MKHFVDATPISGPACVECPVAQAGSRFNDVGDREHEPARLGPRAAMSVSTVSPDWLTATTNRPADHGLSPTELARKLADRLDPRQAFDVHPSMEA